MVAGDAEAPRRGAMKDGEEREPFGAALVAALKREGGLPGWSFATVQRLKRADREEAIRILRAEHPLLSWSAIQRLRREAPEELARGIRQDAQARAAVLVASSLLWAGLWS
jgi:hypothetical protein